MQNTTKTILIVEDDQTMRQYLLDMFDYSGFDVLGAETGHHAIRVIVEQKPDLILCDIMMPNLDGYDVLRMVRGDPLVAATPFIFLTARNEVNDFRKGMDAGADDYLGKPFTPNQLLAAVLSAFKKRELIRTAILNEIESHVFISYSHSDTEVMKRIRDSLAERHLKIWSDDNLEPGTPNWEQTIVGTMKRTGCLVVILSPNAERSKWVGRELAMAETLNLRIFPILAQGDESNAIPIRLISHQWVDIRHNYSDGMDKLIVSIRKHLRLDD